jgi:hypothetical protein
MRITGAKGTISPAFEQRTAQVWRENGSFLEITWQRKARHTGDFLFGTNLNLYAC